MLGQRPEALNWELGVLGSILTPTCSVTLTQSFLFLGLIVTGWLDCGTSGFLSPQIV